MDGRELMQVGAEAGALCGLCEKSTSAVECAAGGSAAHLCDLWVVLYCFARDQVPQRKPRTENYTDQELPESLNMCKWQQAKGCVRQMFAAS